MIGDGRHTYAYSTLKSMRKEELISVIRCLEGNLISANNTLDIQAENCKKLLANERAEAIDEFVKLIKESDRYKYFEENKVLRVLRFEEEIEQIAEQMKGADNDRAD